MDISTLEHHANEYAKLDPVLANSAQICLLENMEDEDKIWLVEEITKNPEFWWAENVWHFRGGMSVRNFLRHSGYGEEDLGVKNLDDVYVAILEKAVQMEHPDLKLAWEK